MAEKIDGPEPFKFEVYDEYFPHEAVADQVVWPLVDHFWRGDWREESAIQDEFTFPKHGEYQGKKLDVVLMGESNLMVTDTENIETRVARICIEEAVDPMMRQFVLDAAKRIRDHELAYMDTDEADDSWPFGDEDNFIVRTGQSYSFEATGELMTSLYRSVSGPFNTVSYPYDETSPEVEDEPSTEDDEVATAESEVIRLRQADMELLLGACKILKAPRSIRLDLEFLMDNPIKPS